MNIMTDQNTGASEEFKYVYGTKLANVFITGTFDGATVVMQAKAPNGDWVDVKDGEIFEPTMASFTSFPFTGRLNIINNTANTSISAEVVGQVL